MTAVHLPARAHPHDQGPGVRLRSVPWFRPPGLAVPSLVSWLLLAALLALLSACGGGGRGGPAVTNLTASVPTFGRALSITANGSGLDDPGVTLSVQGPCTGVTRNATTVEFQLTFSCTVNGVGDLVAILRNVNGVELGRLSVTVPVPRVSMTLTQGSRSGTMVIELDPVAAPVTVTNFLSYVNSGFYRNTFMHRVVPLKLAQGGGYETGPQLKANTTAPIVLESRNGLRNLRGTIAMARTSEPNSATSQFFFNVSDNPEFDFIDDTLPGYAVFGRLISGLDVLDELGRVSVTVIDNALPSFPQPEVTISAISQVR